MPTFSSNQLFQIAGRVLRGAGVSEAEADMVAAELRDANLVGHDSHGVMRLMQYVDYIEQGYIKPGGTFEIVKQTPAFAVIDGNFNFGQVMAAKALELGIEKARACGAATLMIRNCNHVGRLGSYSQQAAGQGIASMMAVNAPGPGGVAPYGGIERKLGTNPISMAAPWGDGALVLDMTTSASAEGKLRVAFQKGESVPEGWIIDAEGRPSTDPAVFYADPPGSLLPLGGPLGFKGFGLSVMIDLFGGILSGSGICRDDLPRGANGVWMYLVDVQQFQPLDEYQALLDKYVASIKGSKRMPGVEEILMPGEIEQRRQQQRTAEGVSIPDETWRQIRELAGRLGVLLEDV
jgi:hydroxycarboxylate dehydrogenase B